MTPFASEDSQAVDRGEKLAKELLAAWQRNEHVRAEEIFVREPALLDHPQIAVRVIFEELCVRLERGEEIKPEEIATRFPKWRNELIVMLDCRRLMDAYAIAPRFPDVGDRLGDFELLALLGCGTSGRVFLARQVSLTGRPVVLKITPLHDREVDSLARLQHTHIIPLYEVRDFPARGLRVLCQPHFGGTTLARLLEILGSTPASRRTGRSLVEALAHAEANSPVPLSANRGPREALANASYVEAICWIGACLADALQHAHERNLIHLDLKPSNVLLATDGQPLLLDFHLARHPIVADQPLTHGLGGTPQYMSPEQRSAFSAINRREPVSASVDRRSDIYSLGRLLYVGLGGPEHVDDGCPSTPLQQCNAEVSPGLSDIVQRCLQQDPRHRYATMAELAVDLRRHRAHLPLRGVSNRSWNERWRKWRKRRPHLPFWFATMLLLSIAPIFLIGAANQRHREARQSLLEGQVQLRSQAADEALRTLMRGQKCLHGLPGCQELSIELDREIRLARRVIAMERLHDVTEKLRFSAGNDSIPMSELHVLDGHCRSLWKSREELGLNHGPLSNSVGERFRADLIDLVVLWVDIKMHLAGDKTSTPENQQVIAEVERFCGPSIVLARTRNPLAAPSVESLPAATSWEHAALGRTLLRFGDLKEAAAHLDKAVALRPQDFWSHFYRGLCAYRSGDPSTAVNSFTVALALAPESAVVCHNRGLAHAANGNRLAAVQDFERALLLDPNLSIAAQQRELMRTAVAEFARPSK